jgi:hypothetical protein
VVDENAVRLRELRREEWADTLLTVVVLGLALAASQTHSVLATPLVVAFIGAVILALRAFWRRWELLDRLLLDRDAYAIAEVRARAEHIASMKNRHDLASSIRSLLEETRSTPPQPAAALADELEALAVELDDAQLGLDPRCAVLCQHLLTDGSESPPLNRRYRSRTPSPACAESGEASRHGLPPELPAGAMGANREGAAARIGVCADVGDRRRGAT